MLTEERYRRILQHLKVQGFVKIQELCDLLGASESTVRRDLVDLEDRQLLKRIHGGATLPPSPKGTEPGMAEKTAQNLKQKQRIASLAAGQVQEGESIYLDAGTTTLAMIPYLEGKNVTVVTNGLSHIEALMSANIHSYLLGGMMKMRTRAVIGSMAMQNLGQFRLDRCYLGANGVHPEMGYTTPDPEEAALKRRASELSSHIYVVADSSKIGAIAFAQILELEQAALVTEEVPASWRKPISEKTNIIEG